MSAITVSTSLLRRYILTPNTLSENERKAVADAIRTNPEIARQAELIERRKDSDARSKGVHGDYE